MRKNRKISKCTFMPLKLWYDFAKLNTNTSISLPLSLLLVALCQGEQDDNAWKNISVANRMQQKVSGNVL